jgi:putative porin
MGKRNLLVAVAVGLAMVIPARAETPVEKRLRILEQQLKDAQDEIKTLRKQVEQDRAIGQATQKQVEQNVEETKTATAEVKKVSKLPDWLNTITPFGDVRYRHEGFYNQPHLEGQVVTANNRERIRARLGVRANFGDEVGATIRMASGNVNDPISTNQTESGNFTPFTVNLDWAYLTLAPGKTFNIRPGLFTMDAGKFANPMFRVGEMVFDEDLAPEGFNETFALLDRPLGDPKAATLDQLKLYLEQWTFSQINNKADGWMFGGQINPSAHLGPLQLDAGIGQYWWLNPDEIAQATSRNTTAFTASGAPVANSNFNSSLVMTNQLKIQTIQPPTQKGSKQPAPFTSTTGFLSDFNETNLVLGATLPNVVQARPLKVFLDYVYNWGAVNKGFGWQGGVQLGQTKVRGDWAASVLYEYLEQDAVISTFSWSDFGLGGTNERGPVVGLQYQLLNPLTLSARGYFTNFIDRPWVASQGTSNFVNNPTQSRLQLDAIVKF